MSCTLLALNVVFRKTYLKQLSNIGSVIAIARPRAIKVEKRPKLNIVYKMLLIPPNYSWTRGAAPGQMVVRGFNYPLAVRHFTSHLFGYEINSLVEQVQNTCFPTNNWYSDVFFAINLLFMIWFYYRLFFVMRKRIVLQLIERNKKIMLYFNRYIYILDNILWMRSIRTKIYLRSLSLLSR